MDKDDIINYVMETPGNSNPAVLGNMLESYSGGGVLPTVTSEDNGDVLTVVEGAWAKAAPSGGGVLTIEWVVTNETPTTVQTAKELYDAFSNGTTLLMGGSSLPAVVDEYYASDEDEEPAGYQLTCLQLNPPDEVGAPILYLTVHRLRVEMADAETTGVQHRAGNGKDLSHRNYDISRTVPL